MDKVIIIGGKGSAIVVADQIYDAQLKYKNVELLGFAFDDESFGKSINGFPVLEKTYNVYEKYKKYNEIKFIFQLYRPDLINKRITLLKSFGIPAKRFYTFIHPSCIVSRRAKIGIGSAIMANCVLNANTIIGNYCTIHSNCLIGHDTLIGDYNFLAAHTVLGSNNVFGKGNFVGLNSTFNNYITVGDFCFVGMASNVIHSLESGKKVIGNPAKEYNKKIKPL